MKAFWSIVAIVVLATAGAWWLRGSERGKGTGLETATPVVAPNDPTPTAAAASLEEELKAPGLRVVGERSSGKVTVKLGDVRVEQNIPGVGHENASPAKLNKPRAGDDVETPEELPEGVVVPPVGPKTGAPSAAKPNGQVAPQTETPKTAPSAAAPAVASDPKAGAVTKPTEATKPEVKAETKPEAKAEAKLDAAKIESPAGLNVKLEPQEDGSTLVDGKYVMKGAGTREDPYRLTWEMLLSAEETYRPRLGKKVIPDRLKMIDGKWIRISGYIAFPVMASSGDEMLMMLNQWDGCCIGVPPTPYDAIEVKLKKAAKGNERLRTSGTLTGQFKVDPYLVKDWLISLYVMDDGELSDAKGQANPGMHAGGGGP